MGRLLLFLLVSVSWLHATEDHLVVVPTPITQVGDPTQHVILGIPHVYGYGLDFLGCCPRIASPYVATVDSPNPTTDGTTMDLNPLSVAGLVIRADEVDDGSSHVVTIDFSKVRKDADRIELLEIAAKCIHAFARGMEVKLALHGVAKDSELHLEAEIIQAGWKQTDKGGQSGD